EGDAGRLEAEALDVRRAADPDEDLVDRDLFARAPPREVQHALGAAAPCALDRGAEHEPDAVAAQRRLDDRRRVGVVARQDPRRLIDEPALAAEATEGLREPAADRAGADHAEPARPLRQLEDRLVRAVARLGEALDRRRGSARARGDHRAPEAQ